MAVLPLPMPDAGRQVFTVSELTRAVKDTLEGRFGGLWVEGEISNLRVHTSGHVYFTLKDEEAQMRAVLFRGRMRRVRFEPADGLHVLAFGRLDVYAVRGEYQLVCEMLEPKGLGALQLAFEQLKARLAAEGLFDPARKRPLPTLPRRVGLVTSPTGAAVRDFLQIVTRRFAGLQVLVCPVRVQGDTAAAEVAEALQTLNRLGDLDVIVVARGGGSLEDLWAFNEEVVARAIAASKIPVISAVGHETDVTIADFVADLRAPTPSAAAELVVREKADLVRQLTTLRGRLGQAIGKRTGRLNDRLAAFRRRRVLTDPGRPLRDWARRVDDFGLRLGRAMTRHDARTRERLERAARALRPALLAAPVRHQQRLAGQLGGRLVRAARGETTRRRRAVEALAARLDSLSPLACLARGYAIVAAPSGAIVTRADVVRVGDRVTVRLHDGSLGCRVEDVRAPGPADREGRDGRDA
jgi:exodeoxyribonuclease VII large subunit